VIVRLICICLCQSQKGLAMFKTTISGLLLSGVALTALAQPTMETAKVISATPVVTQVPHQVCQQVAVAVPEPKSGAGAVMGALAGGAVGNALSHGAGNAATTALGVVGGAILGDRIEGQNASVQAMPQCSEQLMQVTMYQVEYELNGQRYTTQMAQDPGKTLAVQVAPTASPMANAYPAQAYGQAPVYAQPPVYAAPAPVVVAPYPYGYPYPYHYGYGYYPPIGINLGFGYYRHR
jgi:uncharacterized protein YcfJ